MKKTVREYTKNTTFKEFNEETRKLSKGSRWEDYPFKVSLRLGFKNQMTLIFPNFTLKVMFFLLSCATTCTEKEMTQYFPESKSEFLYRGVNEFYPPDVLEGMKKNNWICSPANSFISTSEW